jgi:ATP-dependent exoDNAse (exonuclease V) beta subunit
LVSQVVGAARVNGIVPERLVESQHRSWQELERLLAAPREGETVESLDRALAESVSAAIQVIGGGDGTKTTERALKELQEAASLLNSGRLLTWQQWAKLSKISAANATDPQLEGVRAAAAAHARHPRLRDDVKAMIHGIFDCAAAALGAYRDFKLARGFVDFADQEAESLRLLDRADVCSVLAQRLELALVDEFQDTSPIQMALFLKIAGIVRRSLWVGDPKQSIYEFRGADPELMSAVAESIVAKSGGSGETLATSFRSRPALVSFFNDLFVPAFEHQGMKAAQTKCAHVHRSDAANQPPPLSVWHLSGRNKSSRVAALAAGVRRMLSEAAAWPVVPKGEDTARAVRGGDIAILCRANDTCREVANALEAIGVEVAFGRRGLLDSAECALATAALRWLADSSDTLALAEIAHLTDPEAATSQPSWFITALSAEEGTAALRRSSIAGALENLRPALLSMTPLEALDAAMAAVEIPRRIASWGNAAERFGNLDALCSLAQEYEEDRQQARKPATPGGLVDWLERSDAEKPASKSDKAVVVSTYHGAKGLEWPVTILFELDSIGRPRLFDQVVAEGRPDGIDLANPLAGRWLRFWPWPYAAQARDVGLDATSAQSAIGRAAAKRAAEEDVRLLYVAMTRARDYLVLAVDQARNGPKTAAFDGLTDSKGVPLIGLPGKEGEPLKVGKAKHQCTLWLLVEAGIEEPASDREREPAYDTAATIQPVTHPPYRLRPSEILQAASSTARILERISIGPRLPLTGSPDMASLGDAIHAFFAADMRKRVKTERRDMAQNLMVRWGVNGALAPQDVVDAADRLWSFCETRWPNAKLVCEWPVYGRVGIQRVQGRIDLLLETDGGFVIIDHKTYPGRPDTWEERVAGYAPQLDLYARLCASGAGKKVNAMFVHLPVGGSILSIASQLH